MSRTIGRIARRTRVEAKQDTRRRLLEAARRVFLREGFHGATVEMVAAEAGFTKGAVYSAFESKADLFLALYEERVAQRSAAIEERLAAAPGDDVPRGIVWSWAETLRRDRPWHLALVEFWVFAARDRAVRKRFERLHAAMRSAFARMIAQRLAHAGRPVPDDVESIARAHMALGNGFALEGFLDPELVAGAAYERAAAALDEALFERPAEARPRRALR
jgi:AcrR family transcriptional regulator